MLFLSCGFISQDNLIPCRMLAWAQSLKDKPLKAKSLEFRHSKGHIWVTEGVNLIHKAQWETWECQTASFIIHVPRWPLSELKGSFWRYLWPIQIELLLFVCLGVFFCKGVYFPANYKDGTICKYWSNWTLEGGTLGSLWHDFLLSISRLCLMKAERGQLHFCAFSGWPWFSIYSLAFHGGTEAHFPGDITREGSPLWLWFEGLEPAMGQRPKRAGWKVNSQWVTLLREKRLSFLCPGLVGWWGARQCWWIIYQGMDFFPESSSTEKLGKQMGMPPIYLPSRMTGAIFYHVS